MSDLPTKPKLGERTTAQVSTGLAIGGISGGMNLMAGSGVMGGAGFDMVGGGTLYGLGGGAVFGGGGSWGNPLNYPGYGQAYVGNWGTYEIMLTHPVIQHARSTLTNPIRASHWTYECDDGVLDEAEELVEKVLDGLRNEIIDHAARALDYGFAPFEPIWGYQEIALAPEEDEAEGDSESPAEPTPAADDKPQTVKVKRLVIERCKPLNPCWLFTEILVDPDNGDFVGIRQGALGGGLDMAGSPDGSAKDLLFAKAKAWKFTYDQKFGSHWGRPILENVRVNAWMPWVDCLQQLTRLGGKIAGIQAYGIVPAGGYKNPKDGSDRTYAQDAADGITAMAQGKSPVFTSPSAVALAKGDLEQFGKLAGVSFVQVETVDFGSSSPAITGLLARMEKHETHMFQGYLLSPRVGMESQHGSKADSEQHTDTATLSSQIIGDQIAAAVQQLADWIVWFNYGLPAGSVRVKQADLVDTDLATQKELFTTLVQADPAFASEVIRTTDVDAMMDKLGLPRKANFDEARVSADREKAQEQKIPPMLPNGKPNPAGNSKAAGNPRGMDRSAVPGGKGAAA